MQRLAMAGEPLAGGMFSQRSAGDFEAAKNLWNKFKITCKEYSGLFNSQFSLHFIGGHRNYKHIEMKCKASDMLHVNIGLHEKDSDRLAITVESRKAGRESIFDAFDVDILGEIAKHVEVVGAGGEERVLLDR